MSEQLALAEELIKNSLSSLNQNVNISSIHENLKKYALTYFPWENLHSVTTLSKLEIDRKAVASIKQTICNRRRVKIGDWVLVSSLLHTHDFISVAKVRDIEYLSGNADPVVWLDTVLGKTLTGCYHRNAIYKMSERETKLFTCLKDLKYV